jgi:integrase
VGVFSRQGNWWIDYYVDGRRRRKKIGTDKKLAEIVLARRKVEIAENRYLDKRETPRTTFSEMAKKYLAWSKANKRSWDRDKDSLKPLKKAFGGKLLADISVESIEDYKAGRRAAVSAATTNRELALLKHLFSKAVEWGRATVNPARNVKLLREDNIRVRYLSSEEEAKLINKCAKHLRPMVTVALNTGMRQGEVLALRWDQIDLANGLILLDTSTKSGKRREIPINATLRATLERHPRHIRSPYVFCKPSGEPFGSVKKAFSGACGRAKLEGVVFHTLRHTFCSRLVMAGVDLVTVKELLGHSSLAMVLRYAHLSPGHRKAAVDRLDSFTDESEEPASQEEQKG